VAALCGIRLASVFNPYADRCPEHDRYDAARVRRRNVVCYLEGELDVRADTMWIARDLGYRSGRRTRHTDHRELRLQQAAAMMGGVQLDRATLGPPVAEQRRPSCGTCWGHRRADFPVERVPLASARPEQVFSNRGHTIVERNATWPLTLAIGMVRPKRIVAIGRDATEALAGGDVAVRPVRHPSQGEQTELVAVAGVCDIYGIVASSAADAKHL